MLVSQRLFLILLLELAQLLDLEQVHSLEIIKKQSLVMVTTLRFITMEVVTVIVDNKTGDLYIKNLTNDEDVIIQTDDGSGGETDYIICDGSSGEVELYHNNDKKFQTTAAGVTVTLN